MQIEIRRRFMIINHPQCRVKILKEPEQRLLYGKDDVCSGGGGQQTIACKLNGIAKALLSMNQKPLILERFPALPDRLRKLAAGLRFWSQMTVFVITPAILKAAKRQQCKGTIISCFRMVRFQVQGAIIGKQRFLKPVQRGQDGAVIDVRDGVINVACAIKRRNNQSAFRLSQRHQQLAEPSSAPPRLRRGAEHFLRRDQAFVALTKGEHDLCPAQHGQVEAWLQAQGFLREGQGLSCAPQFAKRHGDSDEIIGRVRVQAKRLFMGSERRFQLPEFHQGAAALVMCFGVIRLIGYQAIKYRHGIGGAAKMQKKLAVIQGGFG